MKVLYPMKDRCHSYIFVYIYLAETRGKERAVIIGTLLSLEITVLDESSQVGF